MQAGASCLAELPCAEGTKPANGVCVPETTSSCLEGGGAREGGCEPPCGRGTQVADGLCTPAIRCGPGTGTSVGLCVLEQRLRCGPGTREEARRCVAEPVGCGAGTREEAGLCVPINEGPGCGEGTAAEDGTCVPSGPVECGPDAREIEGECVAVTSPTCADGTEEVDGECVRLDDDRACGSGTREGTRACIREAGLPCGPGTHEADGECVRDFDAAVCSPGTHAVGGECVGDVSCGPGTEDVDGVCTPICDEDEELGPDGQCRPPLACGHGTIERGGQCIAIAMQPIQLPFAEGTEVSVSEGFRGLHPHRGKGAFAVDFPMPEGTPIVAVRAGTVLFVKADEEEGCPEERCRALANYVHIDHGDGTRAVYEGFQLDGVSVEPGDQVCAGQPIGRSGSTGMTRDPQLHLEVRELLGYSCCVVSQVAS